jgi:predicted DCC family thiol-disulfide oxidoreductase YuxK
LIAYAPEIWSNEGLIPDPAINLTYGIIPNLLGYFDNPIQTQIFIALLAILSFCLTIGFQRRYVAILIWYGWLCLFDRNNFINNPGIPYIGWLLLCLAAIPLGEKWSITKSKKDEKWEMPKLLFYGAWALLAIGYTISGLDKLQAPSWRDGSAIFHLLENPLARNWWLREFLLSLPDFVLKIKTWGSLALEIFFLPLALIPFTRKWVWLFMIMMHCGILMIVDFADLTLGMLMIHWFTFDSRWLPAKPKEYGILFFDGVCSVCNGFIDFLMSADVGHTLRFAAIQGQTAKSKLSPELITNLDTLALHTDDKIYTRTDAVIRSLSAMGGIWKILIILLVVPKFIRDSIYRFFAKNRYKWFDKKETCRMPTQEERNKILN